MMQADIWFWIAFNAFVLVMLALDLGVFHRQAHSMRFWEAMNWCVVWVSLAVLFGFGVWKFMGHQKAVEFFTGYLIEYSLSMDNLFVFVLIFTYFKIPPQYQHRVLFWGVLGALVMRGTLIAVGAALVREFEWVMYIFGAFLVYTGVKMAFAKMEGVHPEENPLVRLAKRHFPVTHELHGQRLFVTVNKKRYATPLFLVLIMIETTDLIFAVDSIPAIFAITTDPFIVYSANVFAILGLRTMYFLLANIVPKFHYLKVGLSIVLSFVGVKMLIVSVYKIPTALSLAVIVTVISTSIVFSLIRDKKLQKGERGG